PIAEEIADSVGIDKVYAERLPQEKIAVIKQVDKKLKPIVMVGDGVNDAPSLATADVGIAMGAHGATAASESADAVVLKDDLSLVGKAVKISDDTMNVARQSVLIGIAICTILMLIASFGVIPAIIGAMLQEVVDTVTILWALRARGGDKPEADLVPAQ
ncbi:HAD-IC family P-type ATPase, partial [uncultured Lentilactobacillus sp.]